MSGMQWAGFSALVALLAAFPGGGPKHAGAAASSGEDVRPIEEGTVRLLTYNVAGLPQWLSKRRPTEQVPQIGQRLEGYDLVLLQEDFSHHDALFESASHPYRSGHMSSETPFFGDGLSRLSRLSFEYIARETWEVCNGVVGNEFDCWAVKGFSFARHELAPGVHADVYNFHLDAGSGNGDARAKRAQVDQLVRAIDRRSKDRAVIVAGDSNLNSPPGLDDELMRRAGLVDACERTGCGRQLPDRVFYRSSPEIGLEAVRWREEREGFLGDGGEPLSDHDPVRVDLRWSISERERRRRDPD